jgi:hypothetical protein
LLDELASRPWLSAWPAWEISQQAAREIDKFGQIIAEVEKELPIAEAHLETAQAILLEKVDVISAPNEFNQAISRATAL